MNSTANLPRDLSPLVMTTDAFSKLVKLSSGNKKLSHFHFVNTLVTHSFPPELRIDIKHIY